MDNGFEEWWLKQKVSEFEGVNAQHVYDAWQAATESAKPRWIPVGERLPTKDTGFIPCRVDGLRDWQKDAFHNGKFLNLNGTATHWMEMPE